MSVPVSLPVFFLLPWFSPAWLMGWEQNLTTEKTDMIPDLSSNPELLESIKKLSKLNKEHQQTIFDNITYWYEKEGH